MGFSVLLGSHTFEEVDQPWGTSCNRSSSHAVRTPLPKPRRRFAFLPEDVGKPASHKRDQFRLRTMMRQNHHPFDEQTHSLK